MTGGVNGSELTAIPRELRELPQWVLYRNQQRDGRWTKVPYMVANASRRASSTNADTWAGFDAALAAHVRGRGDGIGFVFSPDDPFVGIDFDACVRGNGSAVNRDALAIVERLGSYTELSPSATGLHVIGRGQVGAGRRTSKTPWGGELEVYDRGRFFTMTGQRFGGPVAIIEIDVGALLDELMPTPAPPATAARGSFMERLDDRDLLEKAFAASNGAKFQALWRGDISGYKSRSEAELALCSMLAFWTGPDDARVDWLFRQSGLVREKWEQREDYRSATIAKAIGGCREFYGQRPAKLTVLAGTGTALDAASAAIRMTDIPLVEAREGLDGHVVVRRADGLTLAAPSLITLATFGKLAAALASYFGHDLAVAKDEKTATAHRFVAALRRHFGAAQVEAFEQRVEGWMVNLVRHATEVTFRHGDAESRVLAWRALDELDPEAERSPRAFAGKVALAHELLSGDRYLQAGWAQGYMQRCGFRGSTETAATVLEAVGLERPGRDGRVHANWRAGGETLTLRFWVIPSERFEHWADS